MELELRNGDYIADGVGGLRRVGGREALLQRVLFRLTARRGSFPFLPQLGSRMHLLRRERPSEWDSLALQYAMEALEDMEGVQVTGAAARRDGDGLLVTVELLWQGTTLPVEVRLEG